MTTQEMIDAYERSLISEADFRQYLKTQDGQNFLKSLPPLAGYSRTIAAFDVETETRRVFETRPYAVCAASWAGVSCRRHKGHGGLCTAQRHATNHLK